MVSAFKQGAVSACAAVLLFAGCSSSSSGTDGGGGGPTVTVNGTVVNNVGQPSSGQTVVLSSGSFSKTALTDGSGAFSAQNVPTPYTATVVDSGGGLAVAYQGLTRTDPTLTDIITPPSTRSATVTGVLMGGTYPEPSLATTRFIFASPDGVRDLGEPTSANYEAQVSWPGPATTTGTLYAIQIQNSLGVTGPASYLGYGSRGDVPLQDTLTLTGQDVAMSPVTSGTVSGTVSLASGYTLNQRTLQLLVAPRVVLDLYGSSNVSATTFSYTTPAIAGTSVLVAAAANGEAGDYVATQAMVSANVSGLTLELPAAPALSAPPANATGVTTSTAFSWTAFPSGVYLFQVYASGSTFMVVTAATTASIPDLTAAGLPLPTSARYSWDVIGFSPVTSVDALAAQGGMDGLFYGDLTEGQSAPREFTTAP